MTREIEITYRNGIGNQFPKELRGDEIIETTGESFFKWLDEHEKKIGPVSVVGIVLLPTDVQI